ncbi:helix-hairpin-helix domain-containing protein [Hoylesella oralis]|uniref:helix-hairpin-helix domain-containing protein n=1 Tax=Hoylesella oralis TaxID=28134 RepID=UPI0028E45244|nr:helix-hairpin-helix domain-containing protein [Hoylesella oralis]
MFLKEFFYFTKSDRKVILFLLVSVTVVSGLFFYVGGDNRTTELAREDSLTVAHLPLSSGEYEHDHITYRIDGGQKAELFSFDPNTADSTALLKLGLRPWQVRNIYKYRAAGGVYRRPTDFARLYGLTQKQYKAMEPYIHIGADYLPAALLAAKERVPERDTIQYPVKLKANEKLPLNTADTAALRKVPGIGRYYAREIAWYRDRLGGFYRVDQLKEIEGFPEEALAYFTVSGGAIRKLNVNKLTLNQLKRHPYISFYQAKAIADYRRLKGPLTSLNDLKLLKDFTQTDIERLSHYVEY